MKLMSLISLIFSLLYVGTDFSSRFISSYASNNGASEYDNTAPQINLPQLSPAKIQQLNSAYNQYQSEAEVVQKTIEGLTSEQQLQQNGDLLEFYQGDWRYRLLAVIYPDGVNQALKDPMALLRATNTKETDKKLATHIKKIVHKQTLAHYNVVITDTKQVRLSHEQQQITLLMYQPKTSRPN